MVTNLKLWEKMRRGSDLGQRCCVRAKIDYKSKNECMRDPTIYLASLRPIHVPGTNTRYMLHMILPVHLSILLRMSFIPCVRRNMKTDEQYHWILEQFGHSKPFIVLYSRLNMTHTVLSKRKLTWFVDEGLVDGWDDPRMPTIRGILRHGTVEALQDFIIVQGSSRSVVVMEWDKIWAFNKKIIDPIAIRYTALKHDTLVKVNAIDVRTLLIEREDAESLVVNQNAAFINWGKLMILKVHRDHNNVITSVDAQLNLMDKDYKNK